MDRIVTILAVASIAFATVTPVFAQGRFGNEAKERAADREYREAVRRAEHPELFEKPEAKPAEAPAQEAAAPVQEAAPTQAVEPSAAAPAAPATPAPAQ